MPQLVEGLRLLNQADPSVEISLQETGEHILAAIGELHLERCMKDLRERFAKISIEQSDPIVSFREAISAEAPAMSIHTPDKQVKLTVRALPLPKEVIDLLEENNKPGGALRTIFEKQEAETEAEADQVESKIAESSVSDAQSTATIEFLTKLNEAFEAAGPKWKGTMNRIISFGPKRIGPNLLVNNLPGITTAP